MAKLYFRYGAMGSSKTANVLMVRYNYIEKEQIPVLLKPRTDNRDGERVIRSRIGLEEPCLYVDEFLEAIYKPGSTAYTSLKNKSYAAVIVDEAHRDVFGEMMNKIKDAFPYAIFFGFTSISKSWG